MFGGVNQSVSALECPVCSCTAEAEGGLPLPMSLPAIFFLVCLSGLFSGLTLGLLGLDIAGLNVVVKGDDKYLAKCAESILPVREKGNMLLCTLLLGNVAVNSALSILLADLASGTMGFLISTALIVIFGEIIPQAACSRYALQVGAVTAPLVKVLLYSPLFLVTKPLSVILDKVLGQEMRTVYTKNEMLEVIKMNVEQGGMDVEEGEMAKQVAEGALSFRDKRVEEVMTKIQDAYMLSTEVRLDYDTIRKIFQTGYSRIPVYGKDKHDYKGLLYSKDLMLADPEDAMKLGDFIQIFQRKVETFFKHTKLVEVLSIFKKGGTHIGLVRVTNTEDSANPRFEIVGLLSLEDVVEEILQDEIVDETDVFINGQVPVSDGRALRELNLAIFNPVWRARGERLEPEEVLAVSRHLRSTTFGRDSSLELSARAVEWMVTVCEVRSIDRVTPQGVMQPYVADVLFRRGVQTDQCLLIMQGRVGAFVGQEGFRSELGAFSVLGKDALFQESFVPDFDAFLSTSKGRILAISRATFMRARELDLDKGALEFEIHAAAEDFSGEKRKEKERPGSTVAASPSRGSMRPSGLRSGLAGAAALCRAPMVTCFGSGGTVREGPKDGFYNVKHCTSY